MSKNERAVTTMFQNISCVLRVEMNFYRFSDILSYCVVVQRQVHAWSKIVGRRQPRAFVFKRANPLLMRGNVSRVETYFSENPVIRIALFFCQYSVRVPAWDM